MLLTHTPEFHLFFMPFRQLPYLTLTQEFLNGHSVSSLPSIQLYLVAATSFLTWFRLPLHGTHPKTLLFCHLVLSVWFFCWWWVFFVFFFFWSCLSYTGFSAQDTLPIAYIEKPKTYIYTSICAYIDLFALCT